MRNIFIALSLLFTILNANEADTIIKRVDQNIRGKNVYMKLQMIIKTKRHKRSIEMESWNRGKKKSFVKILNPSRDRGITFLSLDGQMWQYIPKIERTIKIPPSMMLQNWMGSDITNDDMVKQSSLVDDYHAKLLNKKGGIATIELRSKQNASVVWEKIISKIDTKHYTQIEDKFYDESGTLVRIFRYKDVKKFGNYYIPTLWSIQPQDKKDHITQIIIKDAQYDASMQSAYFSKSALKRFSR